MIIDYKGRNPKISPSAFIAANAMIIGDVEIGRDTNVWFYSIVRGDLNYIRIGSNCNIQDACVLHVEKDLFPLFIDDDVVLGHRVVLHGCKIGKGSLIGIGAIVLNGAEVGENSIVGAGSIVAPNSIIPPRTVSLGAPAKPVRAVDEKDSAMIRQTLENYQGLKKDYGSIHI